MLLEKKAMAIHGAPFKKLAFLKIVPIVAAGAGGAFVGSKAADSAARRLSKTNEFYDRIQRKDELVDAKKYVKRHGGDFVVVSSMKDFNKLPENVKPLFGSTQAMVQTRNSKTGKKTSYLFVNPKENKYVIGHEIGHSRSPDNFSIPKQFLNRFIKTPEEKAAWNNSTEKNSPEDIKRLALHSYKIHDASQLLGIPIGATIGVLAAKKLLK